VNIFDI
jgi:hypothetical protein